jgi:hypothetical protein
MRGAGRRQIDPPCRLTGEAPLAALVACATVGAVLAILIGATLYPASIGPLGHSAIIVVGSTGGSTLAVLAVAVRKRR